MSHDATAGLAAVRDAVAAACERAGRSPESVTLVAASKTVPGEIIDKTIIEGQLVYGENRVQEAIGKWPDLRSRHPQVELHLIGPLQSNKARDAVVLFDAIHSIDRASVCAAVARQCEQQGRQPTLLVQVNIGAEPQKAGVSPEEVDGFLRECRTGYQLTISGLMCIPPAGRSPEPYFERLAELAGRNGLPLLSMGMSSDFGTAIGYGATHVRVGSAIFGARA